MTDHPPLSPTAFAVLAGLAGGTRSGVEILEELDRADARVLGPGSLYRLLKELGEKGWIEQAELDAGADGRLRSFQLTPAGRGALNAEAERISRVLRMPGMARSTDGTT